VPQQITNATQFNIMLKLVAPIEPKLRE